MHTNMEKDFLEEFVKKALEENEKKEDGEFVYWRWRKNIQ